MKSTQKFLCYSLALVGAALIFSAGCKKGDNVAGPTYPVYNTQVPTLINPSPYVTGALSKATAVVNDGIALAGASTVTSVGFLVSASGITATGGTPITWSAGTPGSGATTGGISLSAPSGTGITAGVFSSSLSTTASFAALSSCVTITWTVQSYATNGSGTRYSSTPTVITTVN